MTITEKAAYLKGLYEGLGVDQTRPEGKLLAQIVELMTDMADEIEALDEQVNTLNDYIEEIDEDLGYVEEDLYTDDDEDEDEDDDEDYYEVECPNCGEIVCFDDSVDPEEVICPACNTKFSCVCDGECEGCESDCE